MPDLLKPIAEVPVQPMRNGSYSTPELGIAPDGSVLYVRELVEPFGWAKAARWYGPDVAGPMLVLAAVVLLLTIRRCVRFPRVRGRLYCRRCNYQVIPPMAAWEPGGGVVVQAGARCSECGTDLGTRRPLIGRSFGRRAWPAWAAAMPIMAICIAVLFLTLDRRVGVRGRAWPIAGLEGVLGSWALQKHVPDNLFADTKNRITRWRLPECTRIDPVWWADVHGFNNGMVAPDGREYVCIVKDNPYWATGLLTIDTQTGAQRTIQLDPATCGGANIIGFSHDGSRVFVQTVIMPTWSGKEYTFKLLAIDLATLRRDEVVAIPVPGLPYKGSVEPPYMQFIVDDAAEPIRWALQNNRYDAGRVLMHAEVTYFDGRQKHEYVVPARGKGWGKTDFVDGGKALEIGIYGTSTSTRIDLETGTITSVTRSAFGSLGASASKRYVLVQGQGSGDVVDTSTGATIARLDIPGPRVSGGAVISNDGRFAVTTHWTASSTYVVGVWDLCGSAGSGPERPSTAPAAAP